MSERAKTGIPFPRLGRQEVANRVRELAQETFNIHWTEHALDRLDERAITMRQALSTLRLGQVDGNPIQNEDGDWRLVLTRRSAGTPVRLVVELADHQLFVVTVM